MAYILIDKLPIYICKYIESFNIAYNPTIHTPIYLISCHNLDGLKWLNKEKPKVLLNHTSSLIDYAVMCNDFCIVKWLHINNVSFATVNAINIAAQNGNMEIVKFLHTYRNEGCSKHAMNMASKNGHLEVVKFLHTYRKEGCDTFAIDYASYQGHLNIVKWLIKHRTEGCSSLAMDWAAKNNHEDIVKCLFLVYGHIYSRRIFDYMIRNNNLGLLKWCMEHNFNYSNSILTSAFYYNNIDIIYYLISKCKECPSRVLYMVAFQTNVNLMNILYINYPEIFTYNNIVYIIFDCIYKKNIELFEFYMIHWPSILCANDVFITQCKHTELLNIYIKYIPNYTKYFIDNIF